MNKAAMRIVVTVLIIASASMISPAQAQSSYPSSPIRLVVGFPVGQAIDTIARRIGEKLGPHMNTSVIVDNKIGAGGGIAAEFVVNSKPDGYTLLIAGDNLITAAALGDKTFAGYLNQLVPVASVASIPHLIVVNPSVPANTLAEFIAYVKANPGKLAYGTAGTGSSSHFQTLLFLQGAGGLVAVHVPYKGDGPAAADLVAGRIQFEIMDFVNGARLSQAGQVRALAVTAHDRSTLIPNVPAVSETMSGLEFGNTDGINAPLKTPRPIVQQLSTEIVKVVRDPDVVTEFQKQGITLKGAPAEAYGAFLKGELEQFSGFVKSFGLQNTETK